MIVRKLRFKKPAEHELRFSKPRELRFVKPPASEPDKYPSGHFRNFTARKFAKTLYKMRKKVQQTVEFIDGICDDPTTSDAQNLALRKIRPYFADALRSLPAMEQPKDGE